MPNLMPFTSQSEIPLLQRSFHHAWLSSDSETFLQARPAISFKGFSYSMHLQNVCMAANNRSSGSSTTSKNSRNSKKNTSNLGDHSSLSLQIVKSQNSLVSPFIDSPYFSQTHNSDLSQNYELAYHQHNLHRAIQNIQMGQFYNPELSHYSAGALAMRPPNNQSGSDQSSSAGAGSVLRINGHNNHNGNSGNSSNGITPNWLNNGGGAGQRLTAFDYPPNFINNDNQFIHPSQLGLSVNGSVENVNGSSDIWPGTMDGNRKLGENEMGQRLRTAPTKSKKPRRRVASVAQRRAANIRERRRMFSLNEGFDKLRRKVPTFAYEKRLSRIETLRLAVTYIGFMGDLLAAPPDDLSTLRTINKTTKGIVNDRSGSTVSNQHANSVVVEGNLPFLNNAGGGGGGGSIISNDISRHFANGLGGFSQEHNNNNSNTINDQVNAEQNNLNQNIPRISPYPVGHMYYHAPPPPHHSSPYHLSSNIHHH